MCVPTPAKDINSTTCVHIDSMCIGCSMSVPLRAIALQPFLSKHEPTESERNQKLSKCKRINVNGKHTLHMAVFHKLLHNHSR